MGGPMVRDVRGGVAEKRLSKDVQVVLKGRAFERRITGKTVDSYSLSNGTQIPGFKGPSGIGSGPSEPLTLNFGTASAVAGAGVFLTPSTGSVLNSTILAELATIDPTGVMVWGSILLGVAVVIGGGYFAIKSRLGRQRTKEDVKGPELDLHIVSPGKDAPSRVEFKVAGETFFEDLFRPLTVPELKASHPGAEAFMATVTGLIGKDGKADPAVETVDGFTALLQGKFPNAKRTDGVDGFLSSDWMGNSVSAEASAFSVTTKKALPYWGPGDSEAQVKSGEILPAHTTLVISQGFDAQGAPVAEGKTDRTENYTLFEVRFYYNEAGSLTDVTLRKLNDASFQDGAFSPGGGGAKSTSLLTRMDGAGNVSWPAKERPYWMHEDGSVISRGRFLSTLDDFGPNKGEPVTVGGATEDGVPLSPEFAKQYQEVRALFAEHDAELDALAEVLRREHPELEGRPEFAPDLIKKAVEMADEKWNNDPPDINRVTNDLTRKKSLSEAEKKEMMALINGWMKARALETLFPKPKHVLLSRSTTNGPARFSQPDVPNLFEQELLRFFKNSTRETRLPAIKEAIIRWSQMPKADRLAILNSELRAAEKPELTPEEAATTISFNWLKSELNGRPSLYSARRRSWLDNSIDVLFDRHIFLGANRSDHYVRRVELHPLALNEAGNINIYRTLDELKMGLEATTVEAIDDPRTTGRHVFQYTNAYGQTIVVFRSAMLDSNGKEMNGSITGHTSGAVQLPPGEYHELEVHHTFEKNGGGYIGAEVVENVLAIQRPLPLGRRPGGDVVLETLQLVSDARPGVTFSMAEFDAIVNAVTPAAQEAANPPGASGALAESSVRAALDAWYELPPEAQVRVRRSEESGAVRNPDAEPIKWLEEMAKAYIDRVTVPAFELELADGVLKVSNISVPMYDDSEHLPIQGVFSLKNSTFPPMELVDHLTSILIGRGGFEDIPVKELKALVREKLLEEGGTTFIKRGEKKDEVRDGINIIVNGERMKMKLGWLDKHVRYRLFGTPWEARHGISARFKDALRPIGLPGATVRERIPRSGLPELSLDKEGNLRNFETLNELRRTFDRRLGQPNFELIGNGLEKNIANGESLAAWRSWNSVAVWHELRDGYGAADYARVMNALGWSQDLPAVDFKYVVTLRANISGADLSFSNDIPVHKYDVRYFFDASGRRVATTVVRRTFVAGHGGRIGIGVSARELKERATTVLTQFAPKAKVAETVEIR